ncbi:MAG TPA: Mbeg1-like protein, partial [Clostridia bacterium]
MNKLDAGIKNEANEAALLNVIMYMDIQDVSVKNGSKVSDIIHSLGGIYDSPDGYNEYLKKHKDGSLDDYKDRQRQYQLLASASNSNSHFANSKIGDQSRLMNNPSYKEGGLGAATFTDTDGNVKVAYRGTGSGEWIDNGRAISGTVGIGSAQQKEAVDYFNRVVESNHYDVTKPNIEITGHSKGGNKAQFVTINSQYRDLIYRCYNFDGQGMSPEAIEDFKKTYGEDAYIEATNKMYGFYNENDFVNPLGIYAVPESHRYYFESTAVKHGIADDIKYHYWDSYLNDDGTFSKQTEQGPISKLVEDFS